jgi:hypothetical protein
MAFFTITEMSSPPFLMEARCGAVG